MNRFFIEFWWILTSFVDVFLVKMAINIEKGDFMKMSVSFKRNAHFHRFGTWFWKPKSIKRSIKKRMDFGKHFWWILLNFGAHFGPILHKKRLKKLIKFGEKTANRVQEIRHLKYTLPAPITSRGVPLGNCWVGVRRIICRFVDLLINWNVLRGSKRLALKGWRICMSHTGPHPVHLPHSGWFGY